MPSQRLQPTIAPLVWTLRAAVCALCAALSLGVFTVATVSAAPQDTTTPPATPAVPPLTGPRPQQDTFTAADEAPGSRNVTISFTDNFIADRLPFDVPFNVVGTVQAGVRRLELTVYRVSGRTDLAALIQYLQTTVDCVGQKPPGRRVSGSAANVGDDNHFSLFVNALDPQNYYAFCFVGVTPVPNSEIQNDVRRILAAMVPRLDTEGDISLDLLKDVRAAMSARITALGAGRPVGATIPPGNLFDTSRPNDPRFALLVGPLVNPYVAMGFQTTNYNRALQKLLSDLAVARTTIAITSDLLDALPQVDSRLPSRESAITGTAAFDQSAFTFASARTLLDAALKSVAGRPADLATLNLLVDDLKAVVTFATAYGGDYDRLQNAATALVGFVALEARSVTVTLGSSVLSADLARNAYVSLDAGIAYPWRLENMVFYAGTNIYFRPINKAAPLRYKGTFLHRFALTVGVTTTVKDESRRVEDLRTTQNNQDTSNSLLLGAGFRVTPSLRVGGGVLVFKETDPNPLLDQTSVVVTPYVSFTADVNVAEIFRSLF
jgi:hypothetical protein